MPFRTSRSDVQTFVAEDLFNQLPPTVLVKMRVAVLGDGKPIPFSRDARKFFHSNHHAAPFAESATVRRSTFGRHDAMVPNENSPSNCSTRSSALVSPR